MARTVVILGGHGKIGGNAARAFAGAGWQVRHWTRGTDMTVAARGADIIVNGLNPPNYHDWARLVPAITAQVIAAARASGARVIIPGNIYNFGNRPGVLSEATPQTPHTRKGRIRVEMEQAYRAAGVPTIVLRAGNFIDPGSDSDVMALLYLRAWARRKITLCGGAEVLQAYAYLPDWARAAVLLADRVDRLSVFEDIPFPGHAFTATEMKRAIEDETGQVWGTARFPWGLFRLLSPVWELAREMQEMRYLWDMPHQLSGEKFDRTLPDFVPTDARTVMLAGLIGRPAADKQEPQRPARLESSSI